MAKPGESVLLLSYPVQAGPSPYRSISPIFVRESAESQYVGYDEIPAQMSPRLMSVRALDHRHHIVAADVVQGSQLGSLASGFLPSATYPICTSITHVGDVTSGGSIGHRS
ncbi:DUF1203 domain-containing protein [Bradyrhizobium sp. STM 3562]|uniref:DUF1203 domain-containing protein n=1 Tax=Bradyrhizobium sp. STM 3562 TaxID=578924 RepID=UPI0038904610